MFSQSFYEESDRNNRRRWMIIGLVFLTIFAFIAIVVASCINQPTQEDIELSISKSPVLSELDRFCQELPKPLSFKYKFKTLGGNSLTSSIGYWYESDWKFSQVRDFYASSLEKEGWSLENLWDTDRDPRPRLLKYRKGKRTISVELIVDPNADYALDCNLDR